MLFLGTSAFAGTIYVDDDGPADFDNIQAAINNAGTGDTVIVKDGLYTGDGNRDIDFLGKAITVRSENGPVNCIIDCNTNPDSYDDWHDGFYFRNNEEPNSIINGLTIKNAKRGVFCDGANPAITNCLLINNYFCGISADSSNPVITDSTISGTEMGPAIEGDEGNLTVHNCNIYGNAGGIIWYDGNVIITNSTISNNLTMRDEGNGIACAYSSLTIDNCTISGNDRFGIDWGGDDEESTAIITNSTISGNNSGGIAGIEGDLTINNCNISGNASGRCGGGIGFEHGDLTINNCNIYGNTSEQYGGGIYFAIGDITINECKIYGNSAVHSGGGLSLGCNEDYSSGHGNVEIKNCIISCNTAAEYGGAIICSMPSIIEHSTITGNSAIDGRALYVQPSHTEEVDFIVDSCILWNGGNEIWVDNYSYYYQLDISYSDVCGGWIGPNIDADPLFVRAPDDGGDGWGDNPDTPDINEAANDDYGDLHLQGNSPCINTGNPSLPLDPNNVDMDGESRVMGLRVDMGADEFPIKKITVTKPYGGEIWATSSLHKIIWETIYPIGPYEGPIDIFFSKNGGDNWRIVASGLLDTGAYDWHLPDIVDSDRCLIKVVPAVPDPNFICIESGLFTIQPSNPDPIVAPKWKTLSGDFKRTGQSSNFGPELGCVKWKFETDGPVLTGAAIGHDGRIHIACEDGILYTLDANGTLLWSYDANSPLLGSPTIGPDGSIYVGSKNGKLLAIDIFGNLRWTHDTGGFVYSSPAISQDGKIYVCSQDGTIYALARDGGELWSFTTKGPGSMPAGSILASPAVAPDGTVYIAGLYDPNLYALDPNDGSVKWVCNFEPSANPYPGETGWPFTSPVVAQDGTIYQTLLYDSNLYAIEPNTGTIIWATDLKPHCEWLDDCLEDYSLESCLETRGEEHPCGDWFRIYPTQWAYHRYSNIWSEPVLGPDGTIYISFDDPYLRIVEPNGRLRWVTDFNSVGGFTLTAGSDGLVYAASDDGNLFAIHPNGPIVAQFQSDAWLSYPVIAADDKLIVSVSYAVDNPSLPTDTKNGIWMISRYGCEDLNIDGNVNFIDLALLAADWLEFIDAGQTYLTGDIDRDRHVLFSDLAILANRWLDNIDWLLQVPLCQASKPYPPDGETGVPLDIILSWFACPDATSYDIYFGTTNPPPFIRNQPIRTTFKPGTLDKSTWYYWHIDVVTPAEIATGNIWTFETTEGGR